MAILPTGSVSPKWLMSFSDRDAGLAVTPDGLRAQSRDFQAWQGSRATKGVHSGGKYYFEATVADEGLCRVGWSTSAVSNFSAMRCVRECLVFGAEKHILVSAYYSIILLLSCVHRRPEIWGLANSDGVLEALEKNPTRGNSTTTVNRLDSRMS